VQQAQEGLGAEKVIFLREFDEDLPQAVQRAEDHAVRKA